VAGGWRRLHNEFHNLGFTLCSYVEMLTTFWAVKVEGRGHSKELYVDEKIILEWILGE